jgi:hypothetical protein
LLATASVFVLSTVTYGKFSQDNVLDTVDTYNPSILTNMKEQKAIPQIDLTSQFLPQKQLSVKREPLSISVIVDKENKAEHVVKKSEIISQPKLASFTLEETHEYAKLADLAYIDPLAGFDVNKPEEIKESTKQKFAEIERLQAEGNRVQFFGTEAENSGLIITHKDGRVSVVYKGTKTARNVATDLLFNITHDEKTNLRSHNGIRKGFYRTNDQVFEILGQIASIRGISLKELLEKYVTSTGHSLGGGLTQEFLAYSLKKYNAITRGVTFGTPRVFGVSDAEALHDIYKGRFLNVMQLTDIIPSAAFGALGYKHFGTKLHIPYSANITRHSMAGYIQALEALRQAGQVKVGNEVFKFEESKRTGIGKSQTIGNTSIPNPLYHIHMLRESAARAWGKSYARDNTSDTTAKVVDNTPATSVTNETKVVPQQAPIAAPVVAPVKEALKQPSVGEKIGSTVKGFKKEASTVASRFVSGFKSAANRFGNIFKSK